MLRALLPLPSPSPTVASSLLFFPLHLFPSSPKKPAPHIPRTRKTGGARPPPIHTPAAAAPVSHTPAAAAAMLEQKLPFPHHHHHHHLFFIKKNTSTKHKHAPCGPGWISGASSRLTRRRPNEIRSNVCRGGGGSA